MGRRKEKLRFLAVLLSVAMTVSSAVAVPDRAYAKETGQTEAAQAETAQGDALSEELVFQDFEADTLDSSASGTLTTEEYQGGKQALCYHRNNGNNWWDVTFASATGGTVDISGYNYITFWVKTDQTNTIEVKLFSDGKDTNKRTTMALKAGEWTFMSVPLSDFSSDNVDKTAITKVGFWDDPEIIPFRLWQNAK